MTKTHIFPWIILILIVINCSMASDKPDKSMPPITVPWDFNAYETPEVVLWREEPDSFRTAEVLTWNGKVLWQSEGYGDVRWAFQDSMGHEVGESFYRVRVEDSNGVHWAAMNVHWNQHVEMLDDDGRHAVVVAAGPDSGTGYSATVTNQDSVPWELTGLAWSADFPHANMIRIKVSTADSTVKNTVVLLPRFSNAYRARFFSQRPIHLDSIKFAIDTKPVELQVDSSEAEP
jgi:hypothetical protein